LTEGVLHDDGVFPDPKSCYRIVFTKYME
jgi:hypothetical protein